MAKTKRKQSTFERLRSGELNRKQRRNLARRLAGNDPGIDVITAQTIVSEMTATGLVGSIPSFAAGTASWTTSLLLISVPRVSQIGFASRALPVQFCLPSTQNA